MTNSRHSGVAEDTGSKTGSITRPCCPGGTQGVPGVGRSVSMANLNAGPARNRGMGRGTWLTASLGLQLST